MTLKTPDEIADEYVDSIRWPFNEITTISATELADMLVAAIQQDRKQREEAQIEAAEILGEWDQIAQPDAHGLHDGGGFAGRNWERIRSALRKVVWP